MIEIDVPGLTKFRLENLLLDLNGTISIDGKLIAGISGKIAELKRLLKIYIITADTHGKAQEIAEMLGLSVESVASGGEQSQKLEFVQALGSGQTVVIGNGSNDALMLRESALGICVVGQEGASFQAISNCDVLAVDIVSALDLLIFPQRLVATLRK